MKKKLNDETDSPKTWKETIKLYFSKNEASQKIKEILHELEEENLKLKKKLNDFETDSRETENNLREKIRDLEAKARPNSFLKFLTKMFNYGK